jgi:hypothetical protein
MSRQQDQVVAGRGTDLTLASVWSGAAGHPIDEDMLEGPPDVFAATDPLRQRADAFRFVLSRPTRAVWPPDHTVGWPDLGAAAAQQWSGHIEDPDGSLPGLVTEQSTLLREASSSLFEERVRGSAWPACERLLTLPATAAAACAGLFEQLLPRQEGHGYR